MDDITDIKQHNIRKNKYMSKFQPFWNTEKEVMEAGSFEDNDLCNNIYYKDSKGYVVYDTMLN